jgi:hypothetical protein
VVRDADGREFSTFREQIGEQAERYQGQRVHIDFHEEQRAGFRNVYLDRVEPVSGGDAADTDPEEAAWGTAVEATPWLVGSGEILVLAAGVGRRAWRGPGVTAAQLVWRG